MDPLLGEDTLIELGKEAVRSNHWRWMPGMLARYEEPRKTWHRCREGDGQGCSPPDPRLAYPDLLDPATLGCVLAIVREVHGDIIWKVLKLRDGWSSVEGAAQQLEAEILVSALEGIERN